MPTRTTSQSGFGPGVCAPRGEVLALSLCRRDVGGVAGRLAGDRAPPTQVEPPHAALAFGSTAAEVSFSLPVGKITTLFSSTTPRTFRIQGTAAFTLICDGAAREVQFGAEVEVRCSSAVALNKSGATVLGVYRLGE